MQINLEVFSKVILSFGVSVTRHAQSTQNKFACLCIISIKAWGMKSSFCLQINTSFLQDDSITLGVISQTGRKYQKQSVYNIFAISKGKNEGWSWFFGCWQMLKIFSNWYYRFRFVWPGMLKLPKITSLLFLYNMLTKKWVKQLIFYMQISTKTCYILILRFFYGYGQTFPIFPKKQVCNVFTMSLKKLEVNILMQINIKVS